MQDNAEIVRPLGFVVVVLPVFGPEDVETEPTVYETLSEATEAAKGYPHLRVYALVAPELIDGSER